MQIEITGLCALRPRPDDGACGRLHRIHFPLQCIDVVEKGLILQPIAHRQVGDCRDAKLVQMLRRADARSHEDGGAAERASGEDDLACPNNLAIDKLHTDSPLALDNYAVHFSVTADGEVGASADRIREVSHPCVDSHTIDDMERIGTHAMLARAVEIRYVDQAKSFRGLNEGAHGRGVLLRRPLADRKRPAAAVPGVIAGRRILQGLVRCEYLPPGPSFNPALGPTRSTHEFNEIAGWAENGMAYCVDVSNLAAGMSDSVIHLELCFFTPCAIEVFSGLGLIMRMDALKECLESRLPTLRVKTPDAVAFFGPVRDFTCGGAPCPTARMAQPLRFR